MITYGLTLVKKAILMLLAPYFMKQSCLKTAGADGLIRTYGSGRKP